MTLHLWPAIKIVAIGGKLTYVIWRAQQNGWDPKKIGWVLIDDARIVLGVGVRGVKFLHLLHRAYAKKSWADATRCYHDIERIVRELEHDATLPERKLQMIERLRGLHSVVMASAAFGLVMSEPTAGESRQEAIDTTMLGLYLYGRTGNRFIDINEQRHACMKLIALMDELDRDFDHEVRRILSSPLPQLTDALRSELSKLPEFQKVREQSGDDDAAEATLYALGMDVERPDPATAGQELLAKFID